MSPQTLGHLTDLVHALDQAGITWPQDLLTRSLARRAEGVSRLGVIGNIKSGKSTLLNALLGADLLPNRREACTIHPTYIRLAPFDGVVAAEFIDGGDPRDLFRHLDDPAAALEQEVAAARRGERQTIRRYHIAWPAPIAEGLSAVTRLELVDAPGANEMDGLGVTRDALHGLIRDVLLDLDHVLFVLNYANLKDDANRELLTLLADTRPDLAAHGLTFVLNQTDLAGFNDPDMASTVRKAQAMLASWGFENARVFPLSARQALAGRLVLAGREAGAHQDVIAPLAWKTVHDSAGTAHQVQVTGPDLGLRLLEASGLTRLETDCLRPWAQEAASGLEPAKAKTRQFLREDLLARVAQASGDMAGRQAALEDAQSHMARLERRIVAALDELRLADEQIAMLCHPSHIHHQAQVVAGIIYRQEIASTLPDTLRYQGSLRQTLRPHFERDIEGTLAIAYDQLADYHAGCTQAFRTLVQGKLGYPMGTIWCEDVPEADRDPLEDRKTPERRECDRQLAELTAMPALGEDFFEDLEAALDGGVSAEVLAQIDEQMGSLIVPQGIARIAQILEEAREAVLECLDADGRHFEGAMVPLLQAGGVEFPTLRELPLRQGLARHLKPADADRYAGLVEETSDSFDASPAYEALQDAVGLALSDTMETIQAALSNSAAQALEGVHAQARATLEGWRVAVTAVPSRRGLERSTLDAEQAALHDHQRRLESASRLIQSAL